MRDIHWLREAEDEFADIIDYVIIQPRTGVFAFSRLNNFVKQAIWLAPASSMEMLR